MLSPHSDLPSEWYECPPEYSEFCPLTSQIVPRKPDAVLDVVRSSLRLKPKVIWMQEGVINSEAADLARKNGIMVVMDRCIMKEHSRLNH